MGNQEKAERLYRNNVGMMVINGRKHVLLCRRIDLSFGGWQMPQGGLDEGEDPRRAALRELEEEIGTANVEVVAETKGWLDYEVPAEIARRAWSGQYVGQRQKWFLLRFLGSDEDITLETRMPEFDSWSWVPAGRIIEFAVDFKREVYRRVLLEFKDYLRA